MSKGGKGGAGRSEAVAEGGRWGWACVGVGGGRCGWWEWWVGGRAVNRAQPAKVR